MKVKTKKVKPKVENYKKYKAEEEKPLMDWKKWPKNYEVVDGRRMYFLEGIFTSHGRKCYILDSLVVKWVPFGSCGDRDKDYDRAKRYMQKQKGGLEILAECELHHCFNGRMGYILRSDHRAFLHGGFFFLQNLVRSWILLVV